MLVDGLSFDLQGLQPTQVEHAPPARHSFGIPRGVDPAKLVALRLVPGPHLATGRVMLPVLRAQMQIARAIIRRSERVDCLVWTPARSAIGQEFFARAVDGWLSGGAFPALGLVSYDIRADGAMQSEGLGIMTGQELRLAASLATNRVAATQLAVRLVNQLVAMGGLREAEQLIGPDGNRLRLEPQDGGKIIGVRAD